MIVLCSVDDCLLFSQSKRLSDELFVSLKEDFLCKDGGEADGCLGVEIKVIDNKLILKHPQLVKRTIELLGLIEAISRSVPVVKPLLRKNTDGKDRDGDSFHYRPATCLCNAWLAAQDQTHQ